MCRIAAVLTAFLLAAPAAAQRRPPVQEGARLRFTLREPPSTWIGTAQHATPDSLVVRFPSGELFRAAVSQIESLQVSGGTRSWWLEGTALGAVFGVGLALLIEEAAAYDFCLVLCEEPEQDRHRAPWAIGGGLLGAVLGGIIGHSIETERWVSVPLDFRSP